jgi:hypothetical protein
MSVSELLILDRRPKAHSADPVRSADSARGVLAATGAVLAIVGWVDWALLWVPLRFGTVEWEFGTISASFDALPLATIGSAVFIAAALNGGWRRTLIVAGVVMPLFATGFLLVIGVYLLDIPVLLRDAGEAIRPVLLKAVAKTSLYAVLYTITYAWLALTCWQAVRRIPRGK